MATLYACIETNPNRKFRLTFQKSFSSKQPTLLSLIDFESELKYIIDDCPLDIMNSKTFSQLKNGLLSIKVSEETPNDIMVTIGSKPSLKLKKIELTEEDYHQEQICFLDKKYEKMIQDFNVKINSLNEEIKFLKSKNEESSQTLTLKTNELNQKIERLETELSRSNTNITNLLNNPVIVEQLMPVTLNISFPDSMILTSDDQAQFLNKCIGCSHKKWTLIHQGSVHGFSVASIHSNILYRGPFIIIAKTTKNYVFGGFNSMGLKKVGVYKQAPGSFLFSLVRNGIETECKKLELIPNKLNHIHDGDHPCIFSDSNVHDLYIADNCNANTTSQSLLGNAYVSGDGSSTYLAGEKNFQVTELEYYIPSMSTYNL